jgi:hypothetical protein
MLPLKPKEKFKKVGELSTAPSEPNRRQLISARGHYLSCSDEKTDARQSRKRAATKTAP